MMIQHMADRVALVTGSSSGIGRGVALVFAREGAKVVITGRNSNNGEETVDMIKKMAGMQFLSEPICCSPPRSRN